MDHDVVITYNLLFLLLTSGRIVGPPIAAMDLLRPELWTASGSFPPPREHQKVLATPFLWAKHHRYRINSLLSVFISDLSEPRKTKGHHDQQDASGLFNEITSGVLLLPVDSSDTVRGR